MPPESSVPRTPHKPLPWLPNCGGPVEGWAGTPFANPHTGTKRNRMNVAPSGLAGRLRGDREQQVIAEITEQRWLALARELVVAGQPSAENPLDPDMPPGREEAVAQVVSVWLFRSTSSATPSLDSNPNRSFWVTRSVQMLSKAPMSTTGPSRSCEKLASEAGNTRNALWREARAATVRVNVITSARAWCPE